MRQQDYNTRPQNFSRPGNPMVNGQMMNGQMMNGQPMGRPMNGPMMGQPMANRPMMPPQRPVMQPQQTMGGGNFAPRPANPQVQMNNGMFGAGNYQQQDTMPGFEGSYNGEDWNNIQLGDVRDNLSKEQAQASVDQMDQFIEQMQGQVDLGVASAGNIDQVTSAINMLVGLLQNPKGWLPTTTSQHHFELITTHGGNIAKTLLKFANAIAQLK